MTTAGSYDFNGYQVLVVGGTRGEGHRIASAFSASGASVTVTGTMMLRSLYDSDLSAFDYESVNLARQDSIDHLVGTIGHIDVLVLAASCNLPYGLPPDELAAAGQHPGGGPARAGRVDRARRPQLGRPGRACQLRAPGGTRGAPPPVRPERPGRRQPARRRDDGPHPAPRG